MRYDGRQTELTRDPASSCAATGRAEIPWAADTSVPETTLRVIADEVVRHLVLANRRRPWIARAEAMAAVSVMVRRPSRPVDGMGE